jgi:hypothetical protein
MSRPDHHVEPVTVTYQSRSYTWDGDRWYGTNDFQSPPQAIVPHLDDLIVDHLDADDEVSDIDELLDRAKRAQSGGQFRRAMSLAERAHTSKPGRIGAATVLCSVLRSAGRPEQALAIADRFRSSGYPPILTSRAAALCDLSRWEEALKQVRQVLAIGMRTQGRGSGEALSVHGRIKANAPDLFDE